jgi:F0F1-type ATP synthase assembly protein I
VPDKESNSEREERGSLGEALKYAQISGMLIGPMLGLGAIGWWLDGRFGTKPWLLLTGLILGMIGGFVNFFRLVLPPTDGGSGPGGRAR